MHEAVESLVNQPDVVNAVGTVTVLGGSRLSSTGRSYMTQYSDRYFDIAELEQRVADVAAEVFGVEGACVTSGAAAGLAIATAGCITRGARGRVRQLPETTGLPSEVAILKSHRILYDVGVRIAGGQFREVGVTAGVLPEELAVALSEETAMLLYVDECKDVRGSLPLDVVVDIAAQANVPVIVDAAAEMPPFSRPADLLAAGADAVVISGGKEVRGPQASGLILGNRQTISWCRANNFPRYGIGRCMKFDRETLFGLLGALEDLSARDEAAAAEAWDRLADDLLTRIERIPGFRASRGYVRGPGVQPTSTPRVFVHCGTISADELAERLLTAPVPVHARAEDGALILNTQSLRPQDVDSIAVALEAVVA